MKIGILGAGSWAIALAVLLRKREHSISMWEFNAKDAQLLHEKREHPLKLPGIIIPEDIRITNNLRDTLSFADYIVCAVPAQTMRSAARAIKATCSAEEITRIKGWVIVSKGIEVDTLQLMTEVLMNELPLITKEMIVVLSGPSHAEEVSRNMPTTIVAAAENLELASLIQNEFSTETFRIYTNNDVIGVELAGSVKNVIALAAGICDGLGLGDNTKGALLTRGLAEMVRLGMALGAREETFSGLAGIGDLITTAISRHSRNHTFGEMIGSGKSVEEALSKMVMVAEGVQTTRSTYDLAKKLSVEMPITEQVYLALFQNKSAKEAVRDLMLRQSKPERWS